MKAAGPINDRITKHNETAESEGILFRFTVACVGTMRAAYLKADGTWTYDEKEAIVWVDDHQAAISAVCKQQDLHGFCRVVRLRPLGERFVDFPTVYGY